MSLQFNISICKVALLLFILILFFFSYQFDLITHFLLSYTLNKTSAHPVHDFTQLCK